MTQETYSVKKRLRSRWGYICLIVSILHILSPSNARAQYRHERLGLALAGGGALGFAHVGVISVLEEIGLDPEFLSGTSIGGIVGALYSAGYSSGEMMEIVSDVDWSEVFVDTPVRRFLSYDEKTTTRRYRFIVPFRDGEIVESAGLSASQNVVELLDSLLTEYATVDDFSELPRPIAIVATDLLTGEEVVFREGDLKSAVRASMAVPGVFTPLYYGGRYLIDGGWVNNLPVDAVRDLGATRTIAVNLSAVRRSEEEIATIGDIVDQSSTILRRTTLQRNIELADVVITPDLTGYTIVDFGRAEELVERGRAAALEKRDELVALRDLLSASSPSGTDRATIHARYPDRTEGERAVRIATVTADIPWGRERPETIDALEEELDGERISLTELRDRIYALYDNGEYEYISYDLSASPIESDAYDLCLYPVPRVSPTGELRIGFGLNTSFDRQLNTRAILNAGYATSFGTERLVGEFDLWFADVPSGEISLSGKLFPWLVIGGGGYIFAPPLLVYDDRTIESLYLREQTGVFAGIETELFRRVLLDAQGFIEEFHLNRVQGTEIFGEFGATRYGATIDLGHDTLDRAFFPTRGGETRGRLRWIYDEEKERWSTRTSITTREYVPLADRVNLELRLGGGSDFESALPVYEQFAIGGPEIFEGYYFGELLARHYVVAGVDLRIRVFPLPLAVGDAAYLRIGGNAGRLVDSDFTDLRDAGTRIGARIGLGLRSVVGEFNVGASLNEDLRTIVFLTIGPAFSPGGNGWDW